MIRYLILNFIIVFSSCSKDGNRETIWAKGVVENFNRDCGAAISFVEDSSKIKAFTGLRNVYFTVNGLNPSYNIQGKKLLLRVAKIKPEESVVCISFGPGVARPQLMVIESRPR